MTPEVKRIEASAFEGRSDAEVLDFDPTTVIDAKMARRRGRFIQLAMWTVVEAVRDSGIDFAAMDQDQRDRVGVVVNTGGGGIEQIIDGTHVHDQKGPRFVSPFAVPALSGSMAACMLSMEYGLTGPVITQVAACATSASAAPAPAVGSLVVDDAAVEQPKANGEMTRRRARCRIMIGEETSSFARTATSGRAMCN